MSTAAIGPADNQPWLGTPWDSSPLSASEAADMATDQQLMLGPIRQLPDVSVLESHDSSGCLSLLETQIQWELSTEDPLLDFVDQTLGLLGRVTITQGVTLDARLLRKLEKILLHTACVFHANKQVGHGKHSPQL